MDVSGDRRWILVLAYGAVAIEALVAAMVSREYRERLLWVSIFLTLIALAGAKQLDLLELLTDRVRSLARQLGLYEYRGFGQYPFLLAILATAIAAYARLKDRSRGLGMSPTIAMAATAALLTFILIRAPSIHPLDVPLTTVIGGIRSGWWMELACLFVIALAAGAFVRRNDA